MNYTMTKPCKHCPFRRDVKGYLRNARAEEIADAITRRQGTFSCHETTVSEESDDGERVETTDSQHCAGAMIMLEKMEMPNQMMRIAERLGMYDASKLDMKSPVFDDADEFVEHHDA